MKKNHAKGGLKKNTSSKKKVALGQIKNLIDLLSNFKGSKSPAKITTERIPQLIATEERELGSTKSKKNDEYIDLLVELLLDQDEKPGTTTSKPDAIDDNIFLRILQKKHNYNSSLDFNVENLAKQILKEDLSEKEEMESDLGAVQTALTRLLGSDPSEEEKISPQVLETIIRLDEFLQEEERERREKVQRLSNLADQAVLLVTGTVDREARTEDTDQDIESIVSKLSPTQIRKLLLS